MAFNFPTSEEGMQGSLLGPALMGLFMNQPKGWGMWQKRGKDFIDPTGKGVKRGDLSPDELADVNESLGFRGRRAEDVAEETAKRNAEAAQWWKFNRGGGIGSSSTWAKDYTDEQWRDLAWRDAERGMPQLQAGPQPTGPSLPAPKSSPALGAGLTMPGFAAAQPPPVVPTSSIPGIEELRRLGEAAGTQRAATREPASIISRVARKAPGKKLGAAAAGLAALVGGGAKIADDIPMGAVNDIPMPPGGAGGAAPPMGSAGFQPPTGVGPLELPAGRGESYTGEWAGPLPPSWRRGGPESQIPDPWINPLTDATGLNRIDDAVDGATGWRSRLPGVKPAIYGLGAIGTAGLVGKAILGDDSPEDAGFTPSGIDAFGGDGSGGMGASGSYGLGGDQYDQAAADLKDFYSELMEQTTQETTRREQSIQDIYNEQAQFNQALRGQMKADTAASQGQLEQFNRDMEEDYARSVEGAQAVSIPGTQGERELIEKRSRQDIAAEEQYASELGMNMSDLVAANTQADRLRGAEQTERVMAQGAEDQRTLRNQMTKSLAESALQRAMGMEKAQLEGAIELSQDKQEGNYTPPADRPAAVQEAISVLVGEGKDTSTLQPFVMDALNQFMTTGNPNYLNQAIANNQEYDQWIASQGG